MTIVQKQRMTNTWNAKYWMMPFLSASFCASRACCLHCEVLILIPGEARTIGILKLEHDAVHNEATASVSLALNIRLILDDMPEMWAKYAERLLVHVSSCLACTDMTFVIFAVTRPICTCQSSIMSNSASLTLGCITSKNYLSGAMH